MTKTWPDGPREWSPRLAQALRDVEKLRQLIPPSLIVEEHEHWKVGGIVPIEENGVKSLCKFALLVKLPQPFNLEGLVPPWKGIIEDLGIVWLYSDGFVYVDRQIYYLLTGQIKGYEHLAGRWPWENFWGPPDPGERSAPEQVDGVGAVSDYGGEGY